MSRSRFAVFGLAGVLALALACGRQPASPSSPTLGGGAAGDATSGADGSTLKVTAPQPISPVNDTQATESPLLTASTSTGKYASVGGLQYRFEVYGDTGGLVQDSGLMNSPSFRVTASMTFKKRHAWRVRAEAQGLVGPWSSMASFLSAEGGYVRGNEVFDPLYNGQTVGERIGPTTFVADKGIRLETVNSYVRYLIPQTITAGEFSMEVQGLWANAPGDKSKVFGMQQGTGDFITDPFRVDIQYRGTGGFPPNAITFRALYGSAEDLDVRYEPDLAIRMASVRVLDPNKTYFWKAVWGSQFRVTVREGGANGPIVYDYGVLSPDGIYNPQPMYAFIGTPVGRSGAESATIPGTIYRNVFIGARVRPF